MKGLALVLSVLTVCVLGEDKCTTEHEQKCYDSFMTAIPYCKKAEESHGRDYDADLNCLKYFYSIDQECVPCICQIANRESLKVRGCETVELKEQWLFGLFWINFLINRFNILGRRRILNVTSINWELIRSIIGWQTKIIQNKKSLEKETHK